MCPRFGTRSARGSQPKLRPSNCTCAMPRKRCCFVSYMMQYHETANEDTLLTNARIQIIQTRQVRRGRRECGAAPLDPGRKNQNGSPCGRRRDGFACRSTGGSSPGTVGGIRGIRKPSRKSRARSKSCPAGESGSTSTSLNGADAAHAHARGHVSTQSATQ